MFRQVSYDANGAQEDPTSVQAAIEITLENRNSNPSRKMDTGKNFAGVLIWDPKNTSKVARGAAMSEGTGLNGHSERGALRNALANAKSLGLFEGMEVPDNLPVVSEGIDSFLSWKEVLAKFNVCIFTERIPCEDKVKKGEKNCKYFLENLLSLSHGSHHTVFYAIPLGDPTLSYTEQKQQVNANLGTILPLAMKTLEGKPGPPVMHRLIGLIPDGYSRSVKEWEEEELARIAEEQSAFSLSTSSSGKIPAMKSNDEAGPSTSQGERNRTSGDSPEISKSDEEAVEEVAETFEEEKPGVNPLLVAAFGSVSTSSTAQSQQMENQGFSKGVHFIEVEVSGSPKAQKSTTPSPSSSPSAEPKAKHLRLTKSSDDEGSSSDGE